MAKLIDVFELAVRYRRCRRTIYRWIREKRLPEPTVVVKGRNAIRYWSEEELLQWERETASASNSPGSRSAAGADKPRPHVASG